MTWNGGSMGTYADKESFKAFAAANASGAWDGMRLDIHEVVADGDKVVARFTNSGTNVGAFMGTPATGVHAEWLGIAIYTVRDGQIVEGWFAEDILGMLLQLGTLSLPG